jgi:hypothetical protein
MRKGGSKHRKKLRRESREIRGRRARQKQASDLPQNKGARIQIAGKQLFRAFTRQGRPIPFIKIMEYAQLYRVDPERLEAHLRSVRKADILPQKRKKK